MAQHVSESGGETQAHCFKDPFGQANDATGRNRRDGFVSHLFAGQPHHGPARARRRRLRSSRSRFNLTLVIPSTEEPWRPNPPLSRNENIFCHSAWGPVCFSSGPFGVTLTTL